MARNATSGREKPKGEENLASFKAFLGTIAAQYSDSQLIQLHNDMHAAARLLLDLYLFKKNTGKNRRDAFDKPDE